ncbi:MAG TPA: hypothetical protein VIM67_07030 [Terriglobus sp.]
MFVRQIALTIVHEDGSGTPVPLKGLDSFAMRNFTNDAVFDDTLPIADGQMELGLRVPIALLCERMDDWLRRKGYLGKGDTLQIDEVSSAYKA